MLVPGTEPSEIILFDMELRYTPVEGVPLKVLLFTESVPVTLLKYKA